MKLFSLLPYIPLSAWKEFHYFSCEASLCAKESVGIEKSSIFNFDRGHQSRIRGLLRVKQPSPSIDVGDPVTQ